MTTTRPSHPHLRLLPVGIPLPGHLLELSSNIPSIFCLESPLSDAGRTGLHYSDRFYDVLGIQGETADDADKCCVRRGDQWV